MILRSALIVTVFAGTVIATAPRSAAQTPPRTPDGQPDLQGVWTNATITPLERPRGTGREAVLHRGGSGRLRKTSSRAKRCG